MNVVIFFKIVVRFSLKVVARFRVDDTTSLSPVMRSASVLLPAARGDLALIPPGVIFQPGQPISVEEKERNGPRDCPTAEWKLQTTVEC